MTWRLPWVSRALAVALQSDVTSLQDEVRTEREKNERLHDRLGREVADGERWAGLEEYMRGLLTEERARYADLLARYHMLKLQGATAPEPERTLPTKKEDPLMAALNEATAGKGQKARKAALEQLKQDRADELTDEQIIVKITRGNRPAEEFA